MYHNLHSISRARSDDTAQFSGYCVVPRLFNGCLRFTASPNDHLGFPEDDGKDP